MAMFCLSLMLPVISRPGSSPSSSSKTAREANFILPDHPEALRKKVTLLGYFRDHLVRALVVDDDSKRAI